MSDLTAIAVILLVPSAAHFTYVYQMKVLIGLAQVTATGVANGAAMPLSARWWTLRNEYLRFFGYIHGLLAFAGLFGAVGYATVRARNLASVLRQAEAD